MPPDPLNTPLYVSLGDAQKALQAGIQRLTELVGQLQPTVRST